MNEEIDRIHNEISLLTQIQLFSADPSAQQDILDSFNTIETQYAEAVKKRDAKDASEADKKYYTGICDSISAGLPGITRGALAAASAFKSGDSMNGAAAIMDICASAAPILASLFSAGGPAGALVGALFSVVGQLLAFFGPQQPSLKDQIQKMLETLNAEDELKNLEGVRLNIESYDKLLKEAEVRFRTKNETTGKRLLEQDLLTQTDADDFEIGVKVLNFALALTLVKSIVSEFETWRVAGWLKMPEKQGYEKWPEVLAAWCRAYMDFVTANMRFIGLVDLQQVRAVMAHHHEGSTTSPLPEGRKAAIRALMSDLAALVETQRNSVNACNKVALAVLKDLTPAVRERGLFLHVGSGYLYACTGKRAIGAGDWTYLKQGSDTDAFVGFIHRVCATFPTGELGVTPPRLQCFIQREKRGGMGSTFVRRLSATTPPENSDERALNHWFNNREWETGVSDLWAIPQNKEMIVYMAVNRSIFSLALNAQGRLENRGWKIEGANARVTGVRIVVPDTLSSDPDRAALRPGSESGALYGGLLENRDIWAFYENVLGHVPSPWSKYTGISVDEHCLWVFGSGGLACATHASVIQALRDRAAGKQTSPRWMAHYPNGLLYEGKVVPDGLVPQAPNEPALRGLIDLSACDDGTLTASVSTRQYNDKGAHTGDTDPCMYTTAYVVDPKAQKIVLDPWTKFGNGKATQVQKLPIHCWSMFESMRANLSAKA